MRRILSAGLIVFGLASIGWVSVRLTQQSHFQRQQTEALNRAITAPPAAPAAVEKPVLPRVPPDGLIGRLEIPRVGLSTIVMEGDDDATLEKAVGHLPDTALPWEPGNSALAGHRDTHFRRIRNVKQGDEIRLTSPRGVFSYRITKLFVTSPDNVGVLAPSSDGDVITLVTCYPFNYVGSAPKRFIVQATRITGQEGLTQRAAR